jgi:hypothetical protein
MNGRTEGRDWKATKPGAWGPWALVLTLKLTATTAAQLPSPGGPPPPGSANPGLAITVRVYNYARVPASILRTAEQETAMIFREAGVETVWADCRVSTAEPQTATCTQLLSSADFFLKLLPPSMARAFPSYADTFGLALTEEGRRGKDAMILYGRIAALATTERLYTEDILACVMAHEIGHLLLGRGHSPTGIMRATLNRWELLQAGRGQLKFTPEQSLLIRKEVAARRANRDERGQ